MPLADAFNHKASVVALGEGFVVGEEEAAAAAAAKEEQEEEEDEAEEEEDEAASSGDSDPAGSSQDGGGGGGGFVGVGDAGGPRRPAILSAASGEREKAIGWGGATE